MAVVIGEGGTTSPEVQQLRIELQRDDDSGTTQARHSGARVDALKVEKTPKPTGAVITVWDPEISALLIGEI